MEIIIAVNISHDIQIALLISPDVLVVELGSFTLSNSPALDASPQHRHSTCLKCYPRRDGNNTTHLLDAGCPLHNYRAFDQDASLTMLPIDNSDAFWFSLHLPMTKGVLESASL